MKGIFGKLLMAAAGLAMTAGWPGSICAAELKDANAAYRIDDATGRIVSVTPAGGKSAVVTGMENRYSLLAKSGDRLGLESKDKVVRRSENGGVLTYECTNPELPEFRIRKRYWLAEGGLRRELTFIDAGKEIRFIMPFTETHFDKEFMQKSRWFGAGYCGPYIPAPKVKEPTKVDGFAQSSKGMVLCNVKETVGSFTHYQIKINDTVVYPWLHSAINTYREKADRLWYLPDGWRMCLGTFDPQPGDPNGIRVTDAFAFFRGDVYNFFSDVWGKDSEVQAELKAIPEGPAWCKDVILHVSDGRGSIAYWAAMFDEGYILHSGLHTPVWGDYRVAPGENYKLAYGGSGSAEELKAYWPLVHALSPRIKTDKYHITVAASYDAPILKEHPEWFRFHDRSGKEDILFPGVIANYQSLMNVPECRDFMATHLFEEGRALGLDTVNLDEAQQQNTIDWDKMCLLRDDHVVLMWKRMRETSMKTGIAMSMNGSGNPYADLNAMEAVSQLKTGNWRHFCGVALGLHLFTQFRQNQIYLLYWTARDLCDYINRCLALGWIPVPIEPRCSSAPAVRAVYELGYAVPLNAKYAPDWKRSTHTEIESYSVRCHSGRTAVLSFMQRKEMADKPEEFDFRLKIGLDTLGFAPEERINLWGSQLNTYPEYVLSDKEMKADFRTARWAIPGVSAPRLLYSGPAQGRFETTFPNVPLEGMAQLWALPAISLYSVGDLVLSNPIDAARHAKIDGRTVTSEKPVTVLLADLELEFADITVDGALAKTRPLDVGGLLCTLVSIPEGTHKLDFKTVPRKAPAPGAEFTAKPSADGKAVEITGGTPDALYVITKDGYSYVTGKAPLALPEYFEDGTYTVRPAGCAAPAVTVTLNGGKTTAVTYHPESFTIPERREEKPLDLTVKGLHLTRQNTWTSSGRIQQWGMQQGLMPAEASADPENLTLHAGQTRRDDSCDTAAFAGLEFTGAKSLRLKLANTFYNAHSLWGEGVHTFGWAWRNKPELNFAGIIVDYHTGGETGKYTRRVAFSAGIYDPRMKASLPPWAKYSAPDRHGSLGDLLTTPETVFTLDLAQYAPEGWDGKIFFSIGTNRVLASRTLTATILEIDPQDPSDRIAVEFPDSGARSMPEQLELLRLPKNPGAPAAWKEGSWCKWSRIEKLQYFPETAMPHVKQQSKVYLTYDQDNLYVVLEAAETGREKPLINSDEPWRGDDWELFFVRPDGALVQFAIAPDGNVKSLVNHQLTTLPGVTFVSRTDPKRSFTLLGVIPLETIGVKSADPGTLFRCNFCRTRKAPDAEYSTWGPINAKEQGFFDTAHYGTVSLGIHQRGQGRYEEQMLRAE